MSYTTVLPAGQDPKTVFVGWTSAQFCYVASQFQTSSVWNGDSVYGQGLECFDHHCAGSSSDPIARVKYSHSSAYLVCVKQLLTGFSDQNLSVSLRCYKVIMCMYRIYMSPPEAAHYSLKNTSSVI